MKYYQHSCDQNTSCACKKKPSNRYTPEQLKLVGVITATPYRPKDVYETIPTNTIQYRPQDNKIIINGVLANVKSYKIIVPDKVIQVNFEDGSFEKAVVCPSDTFDLDTGIRICIAKHVGRKYYNLEGIEDLANRLSHLKCIDKMLMKLHKKHAQDSKDIQGDTSKKSTRKKTTKTRISSRNSNRKQDKPETKSSKSSRKSQQLVEDLDNKGIQEKSYHTSRSGRRLNITTSRHKFEPDED